MQGKAAGRQLGRPRDVRADRAILDATLELIAERGLHEFRTEDVASRARVGKGAIYRRYRSKDELVTKAVAALVSVEIMVPDTGSTHADLLALMREAVELYGGSLPGRLMPNLVSAMAQQPELARAVREGFLAARRAALSEVLRRGVERGDLRPDLDLELALDVLGGPLFYRLLVTGGPLDEQLAEGVAELILRGFAPDEPRHSKTRRKRRSTHDEDPRNPDGHRRRHVRLAGGHRPWPAPPATHDPRPRVDGATADLRLRDRAPGERDRRRHRRERPRLGAARLLPPLASGHPRVPRVGRAGAGDRPPSSSGSASARAMSASSS
jgi:AcrR family transcriptional regulator